MTPSFDGGRITTGCATMSGSLLTGPPREADEGGRKEGWGGFYEPVSSIDPSLRGGRKPDAEISWRWRDRHDSPRAALGASAHRDDVVYRWIPDIIYFGASIKGACMAKCVAGAWIVKNIYKVRISNIHFQEQDVNS